MSQLSSTSGSETWSAHASDELYGVSRWGAPFFRVSEQGHLEVNLKTEAEAQWYALPEILRDLEERGSTAPVLLRFANILDHRLKLINESFAKAMQESGYEGDYRGVYPIKVNQQEQVIEEVCNFGQRYHHGLEAGSKPELIAALSSLQDPEALIVCNGYKDQEFVDLALYGLKMGLNLFLVVEMPDEVPLILERAKKIGIQPRIGLRMRLSSPGEGQWVDSGGDRSVFGLSALQVIDIVDQLREAGQLDCLELLHYHLGSQIPGIRSIRSAVQEAVRVYVDLKQEGAPMGYLDVGGGLAVDYDGSQSSTACSRNYDIEEYCADVVEVVQNGCDLAKCPHPVLISESGRATIAHYSVLAFNILDVGSPDIPSPQATFQENPPLALQHLSELARNLKDDKLQEAHNDALYYRDELRSQFSYGLVSLRERALGEAWFQYTEQCIGSRLKALNLLEESDEWFTQSVDVYYGNFSLFQSLPDIWAIDQLFPIVPLQRLGEEPTRRAVLADITCDCDGRIDQFIDHGSVKKHLPLHRIEAGESYFIGVFLVGAYQETLGDLHNLFGDTHVVSVGLDEEEHLDYTHEIHGDSVSDVLSTCEYDPKDLSIQFRRLAEKAVRKGRIQAAERRRIVEAFDTGLRGYTYFEPEASSEML